MKNAVCRNAVYFFARDAAPGDTKGDGVKEIWSLAKP
jgi:predicted lipoprotein with Yx(FWY)xxD motif